MIAEPIALLVKGREEQVVPLNPFQHRFAVVTPGDGVAQSCIQTIEERRLHQEVEHFRRQRIKHHFFQVTGDGSRPPAQIVDQVPRVFTQFGGQ
ncbi:hypothetical protein D3C80_1950970 [compost metagenome]